MRCSQAVTHLSTIRTQCCLTAVCGREPVDPAWCGRCRESFSCVSFFSRVHAECVVCLRAETGSGGGWGPAGLGSADLLT